MDPKVNNPNVKLSHPQDENGIGFPEYRLLDEKGRIITLLTGDLAAEILEKMKSDLKRNGNGGRAFANATLSSNETLSKSEPIKSSNSGKSNKREKLKATSSCQSEEALPIKKMSKQLLQEDPNRENNKKHKVEEGTSSAKELTTHNATHSYSQFSTDRKSLPTTSDKDIVMAEGNLEEKIERSVASQIKYKNKLPDHSKLKSVLKQTKKYHGVSKTFSQELKNQLTKCSKPQVTRKGQDPSTKLAYLKELDAIRFGLNGIFINLTRLDLVTSPRNEFRKELEKVCSEINEGMKKLDDLNKQYSDEPVVTSSQKPTPMELKSLKERI